MSWSVFRIGRTTRCAFISFIQRIVLVELVTCLKCYDTVEAWVMFEIIRNLKHKTHIHKASAQLHVFSGMMSKQEDIEEHMKKTYGDRLAYGESHQLYRTQHAYISRPQPSPGDFWACELLLQQFGRV